MSKYSLDTRHRSYIETTSRNDGSMFRELSRFLAYSIFTGALLFTPIRAYHAENAAEKDLRKMDLDDIVSAHAVVPEHEERPGYTSFLQNKGFTEEQISSLYQGSASLYFIGLLCSLEGDNGETLFSKEDIARFSEIDMPEDNKLSYVVSARRLHPELGGFEIRRYCQLGVSPGDIGVFEDTIRPNMIYIAPRADSNGAFENEPSLMKYGALDETYDTYAVIASDERDVYDALDKVPDISLLVLGGHGSMTSLQLGENEIYQKKVESFYEGDPDDSLDVRIWDEETYKKVDRSIIDVKDHEMQFHTGNFSDDVVIFLNSCLNGKKGQMGDNLANYIMDHMKENFPGSVVYSSTRSFSARDVVLTQACPLRLQIIQKNIPGLVFHSAFANVTYSNREEDYYNIDSKMFSGIYVDITVSDKDSEEQIP